MGQREKIKVLGITGGVGAGKSTVLRILEETYHARVIQADQVAHRLQEPGQPCYRQILEEFGTGILKEAAGHSDEMGTVLPGIRRADRTDIPGQQDFRENAGADDPGRKAGAGFPAGLGAGPEIDREKLGAMVYRDPAKLQRLNAIVHPAVKAYIREQIAEEDRAASARAAGAMDPAWALQKGLGDPAPAFLAVEAALLLEDHYEELCDEIWYVFADEETRTGRLMASRGYTAEKARFVMANQLPDRVFREKCNFVIDNSGHFMENTLKQIDKGLRDHGFL